ncbi:MAG: hypothetical protein ACF8MJ_00045 [Phycisphaerales bacterium JB050]
MKPKSFARKNFGPKHPKRGQGQSRPERNGIPKREGSVGGREASRDGGGKPAGKKPGQRHRRVSQYTF